MKKILAGLAAFVMASSACAAVAAADYVFTPTYDLPPRIEYDLPPAKPVAPGSNNNTNSSIANIEGFSPSKPINVADKEAVSRSLRLNKPLYASYEKAQIKSNALAYLARKKNKSLKVITKRYSVTIDGSTVTEAKDIDLGIQMTKKTEVGAMILRTSQKGSYGCTLSLTIEPKYYKQCGISVSDAHLYYVEGSTVSDMGAVQLDKNGNINFSIKKGGKYIIL